MEIVQALENLWVKPFSTHRGVVSHEQWMNVAIVVYTAIQASPLGAASLHQWCWTTLHKLMIEDFLPHMIGADFKDADCPAGQLDDATLRRIATFQKEQANEYIRRFLSPLLHIFQRYPLPKEALKESVLDLCKHTLRRGRRWTCLHAWVVAEKWGGDLFQEQFLVYELRSFIVDDLVYKAWSIESKSSENESRAPTTSKTLSIPT